MMKRYSLISILGLLAAGAVADELLARPELAELVNASVPEGVTVSLDEIGGVPVLQITNTNAGAVSVILEEVALEGVSDTRIEYEAQMAASDVSGSAYLELWAVIGGNAYFSRALNDKYTGTQAERKVATPFFLKESNSMEAARLGVRFEGPGTVTLRDLALWKRGPMSFATNPGMLMGIVGSIFGVGCALWASLTGVLALKGIGRNGVLGITLGLGVLSALALAAGVLLWFLESAWAVWYPAILLGAIGTLVFGVGYRRLRRTYGNAEARRMAAMDME